MRKIKYIAVHCTAGSQKSTVNDLLAEFRKKGWKAPGYHYVITADGKIHQLLDTEKVSNGVKGYNSITVNIAYTGGIDGVDNRTDEQKKSLVVLLKLLRKQYPDAVIQGHRDFSTDRNGNGKIEKNEWIKKCPGFDAKTEYKGI
ncbi:MAG: N-acetylmuramoyl-L-alanine amidase [Prevotella sp.]|nr:N-acetylmuramoyl-L-alanine amidase [Paraprevotella sp.]MDD7068589.1 N-acetylmuramoyl-L-alanine amidase [Prevotella sp.]MDY5289202.1 N-acetylmuramoyl-L-alanine amidase [Prevotella sp.]